MNTIKQLIINGKKSFDDFNVYIASRKISSPKKKTIKESLPFTNIVYDFSKIDGELYWEERTLEYTFDIAELSTEEMENAKSKLLNWLLNVHDTDIYDPYIGNYHFHGSYDSDSWEEDFGAGTISVTFSVYPYKISNSDTNVIESLEGEMSGNTPLTIENTSYSQMKSLTIDGASYQETASSPDYPSEIKTLKGVGNFYNFEDVESKNVEVTVDEDGWITCNYDNSSGTSVKYFNYWTNNLNVKTNTQYNIICEVKKVSGTGKLVFVSTMSGSGQFDSVHGFGFEALWNNCIKTKLVTTKTDFTNIKGGLRTFIQYDVGQKGSVTFRLSVIENPSITSDNFNYVPFGKWLKVNTSTPNLYDYKDLKEKSQEVTIDDEGWITCKCDNTVGNRTKYLNYFTNNLNLKPSTNYIVIVEVKEVSGTGRLFSYSYHGNVGGQFNRSYAINLNTLSKGMIKICEATTKDSLVGVDYGLRTYACFDPGENGSITFRLSVLEDTTIVANDFKYCEYGKDSMLINMTDNELVSVGDVKDKLIIDGSTTKIVKNIGKLVLNGSENWVLAERTNDFNGVFLIDSTSYGIKQGNCLCNIATYDEYHYSRNEPLFDLSYSQIRFVCPTTEMTVDEWKTLLSKNPAIIYAQLITPYEIELTNVKLPYTFNNSTQITLNDELETTIDIKHNELKSLIINNESSHRITPTIKCTGNITIIYGNRSYSISEGTYNDLLYLESGSNELKMIGTGKIAFSYVKEVF